MIARLFVACIGSRAASSFLSSQSICFLHCLACASTILYCVPAQRTPQLPWWHLQSRLYPPLMLSRLIVLTPLGYEYPSPHASMNWCQSWYQWKLHMKTISHSMFVEWLKTNTELSKARLVLSAVAVTTCIRGVIIKLMLIILYTTIHYKKSRVDSTLSWVASVAVRTVIHLPLT